MNTHVYNIILQYPEEKMSLLCLPISSVVLTEQQLEERGVRTSASDKTSTIMRTYSRIFGSLEHADMTLVSAHKFGIVPIRNLFTTHCKQIEFPQDINYCVGIVQWYYQSNELILGSIAFVEVDKDKIIILAMTVNTITKECVYYKQVSDTYVFNQTTNCFENTVFHRVCLSDTVTDTVTDTVADTVETLPIGSILASNDALAFYLQPIVSM